MNSTLKIKLASSLIAVYALLVLVNALIYYFVLTDGGTDISRGIVRTIGCLVVAYYIYKKRNKVAYWMGLIGSGLVVLMGIVGITISSFTSIEIGIVGTVVNVISVVILISAFISLFPKEVRSEFK